jgi:hypothetical protein
MIEYRTIRARHGHVGRTLERMGREGWRLEQSRWSSFTRRTLVFSRATAR